MYNQNQLARDEVSLSRIEITIAGKPVSDHDRAQFVAVTLLRFGLETDLLQVDSFSPQCAFRRQVLSLKTLDLAYYYADWKATKLFWLRVKGENPGMTPKRFKHALAPEVHYTWIPGIAARLWNDDRSMLEWLSFDERCLLDSLDTQDEEIRTYVSYEKELAVMTYDSQDIDLCRSIISDWLKDSCPSAQLPRPKFGPGAVSGMKGRLPAGWKAAAFRYPKEGGQKIADLYHCDLEDLFPDNNANADVLNSSDYDYCNQILFVPKSATSHRVISKEPLWLSWVQQAIKDQLFQIVEEHPDMFTWFSNQGASRDMALVGSLNGGYATVDFSSASDSVTVQLVASLFEDTYWKDLLLASRSTHAELPDGQRIELHKFAPMGSATCFVTMDIILLSICEAAVRRRLGRRGHLSDYTVYGDDVVIRVDCYDEFITTVRRLGFRENMSKTYATKSSWIYRESCGIEAVNGKDITPIRYSRFQEPVSRMRYQSSMEILPSWVDLCNRLLLGGYIQTRSVATWLIRQAVASDRRLQKVWYTLPRVDYTDFLSGKILPTCIVVPDGTATNFHVDKRDGYAIQRIVYEDHQYADDVAYMLWPFAAAYGERTKWDDPIRDALSGSFGTRSSRWGVSSVE